MSNLEKALQAEGFDPWATISTTHPDLVAYLRRLLALVQHHEATIAERERPCVWMPTAGGKWSPECSPEAWEPLDTKAKRCPCCGHPVQIQQSQGDV